MADALTRGGAQGHGQSARAGSVKSGGAAEVPRALFGREHHQHLAAFHTGESFNLGHFGHIVLHPPQQVHAKLLVREFATPETERDFHFVTIFDEALHIAHLHVIIMRVDVGTHLDLLDLLRLLRFARGIGLFLGFVTILADIKELADRRIGIGRNFNQIEANVGRLIDCLLRVHHAQILAIFVNDADLVGLNEIVVARPALDGGLK